MKSWLSQCLAPILLSLLLPGTKDETAAVDMSGWTIDNDLLPSETNQGYIKFGDCFSETPVGTVILIYDEEATNEFINPLNDGMPNDEKFYQIPFSSQCLEKKLYNNEEDLSDFMGWNSTLALNHLGDALKLRNAQNELVNVVNWKKENFSDYESIKTFNTTVEGDGSFLLRAKNEGCYTFVTQVKKGDLTPGGNTTIGSSMNIQCSIGQPVMNGNDGIIQISITGGTAPFTIEWAGPNNGTMTVDAVIIGGSYSIENLPQGYYNITVTDSKGCENTCSIQLSSQEENTTCEGECVTIGSNNSNPDYCYLWEPKEEFEDSTLPQQEVCPKESMTYTLTITDTDGDIVEVLEEVVNVSTIDLDVTPNPATICNNNPVTLDAGSGYVTYSWKDDSGVELGQQQLLQVSQAGKYTVEVTNDEGCSAIEEVDVIDASNPDNIKQYLENLGFSSMPITVDGDLPNLQGGGGNNLTESATMPITTEHVDDCALLQISVNNDPIPWHLAKIIDTDIEKAMEDGITTSRGKITSYDNICNNSGCGLDELFNIDEYDCSIQAYIYDDPQSTDDYLLLKFNTVSLEKQIEKYNPVVEQQPIHYHRQYDESLPEPLPPNCPLPDPQVNYKIAEAPDGNFYGYTCVNNVWQQGDITQIKLGDELNGTDNLYSDFPTVMITETFLGFNTRAVPSLKAYNLVTNGIIGGTTTMENRFETFFKIGTIHLLSEKNIILDHFIEGFPTPPYNSPPGLGSHNDPIVWGEGTEMSKKVYQSIDFQKTLSQVSKRITSWLEANNGSLDGLFTNSINFDANVSDYPVENAAMQSLVWPKQIWGGTQAISVYVTNIDTKITPQPNSSLKKMSTVVNVRIEMRDTFGAGHDDGARWKIPGLVEMYAIQHFKNSDTSSPDCNIAPCYVPFSHGVVVPFKIFYVEYIN